MHNVRNTTIWDPYYLVDPDYCIHVSTLCYRPSLATNMWKYIFILSSLSTLEQAIKYDVLSDGNR